MLLNTSTVTVQAPAAGIVAPVSRMLVAEAAAMTVPLAQVVDAFGVVATTRPPGSESVKAACVRAAALAFSRRIVSVAGAPGERLAVPVVKPLGLPASRVRPAMALCTTTGNFTRKVSLVGCELLAGAPPMVAVTPPAGMVLT